MSETLREANRGLYEATRTFVTANSRGYTSEGASIVEIDGSPEYPGLACGMGKFVLKFLAPRAQERAFRKNESPPPQGIPAIDIMTSSSIRYLHERATGFTIVDSDEQNLINMLDEDRARVMDYDDRDRLRSSLGTGALAGALDSDTLILTSRGVEDLRRDIRKTDSWLMFRSSHRKVDDLDVSAPLPTDIARISREMRPPAIAS